MKTRKIMNYVLAVCSALVLLSNSTYVVNAEETETDSKLCYGASETTEIVTIGEPMFRVYNPNSGEHLYTKIGCEVENLKSQGWINEGVSFYCPITYGSNHLMMYRLYNKTSGKHFFTTDSNEKDALLADKNWTIEGVAGYLYATVGNDANFAVYRLYNSSSDDHLLTVSESEKDALISAGWTYEGIIGYSSVEEVTTYSRTFY